MTDSTHLSAEAAAADTSSDDLATAAGSSAPETSQDQASQSQAVASGAAGLVQLAQAVVDVPLPNPGQTIVIQAVAGETLHFLFDPATAQSSQEDGNLVLQINGGEVVIEGWETASAGGTPVEITNVDGTVINLADFLVALGLPPTVEPAAGGAPAAGPLPETTAPNQGAGFTPGEGPQILGALDPDGPVDPTALAYRVPEREQTIFDLQEGGAGPDANDDGPGTNNEAVCVDEETLIDGGEGGYSIGIQTPTDGAAMKSSVTVNAGDTLTFKFDFLETESAGQTSFFDFAVVVIGGQAFKLADVSDATTPLGVGNFEEHTGYATFSFTFTAGGTFDIGFAVLNEGDTAVDPTLLLDEVRVNGALVEGFEGGLGAWTTTGDVTTAGQVGGIDPTEGTQQARLDGESVSAADIETFLGLPAGTLQTVLNADLFGTSVSDNVLDNDSFGPDGPGGIVGIAYAGGDSADPLTVTDDGGSPVITFTANDGSNVIWTLQFNLDTGDYTFTLLSPYQHSGPGADEAHERFTYTIEDSNGDTDSATLSICIKDDVPTVAFTGAEGGVTLDETPDSGDEGTPGVDLAQQTVSIFSMFATFSDFGADGPGSLDFSLILSSQGADSGLVDTASGNSVFLFDESGVIVGREGSDAADAAGGDIVFTVELSGSNVTVTQLRAIVHDDPTDPVESGGAAESIASGVLGIQAIIIDDDGDTDSDIADLGERIHFEDDGPSIISGGEGQIPLLVLDESVGIVVGDPNADDETNVNAAAGAIGFAHGSAADLLGITSFDFGADGPGSAGYELTLSVPDADSGINDTATGQDVLLQQLDAQTIVGTIDGGETEVFRITVDATTGDIQVNQFRAVEHDDPTDSDESGSPESIDFGLVGVQFVVTDGDGDSLSSGVGELGSLIRFEDDGPTALIAGEGGAEIRIDESVGYDFADPNANDEEASADPDDIGYALVAISSLLSSSSSFGSDGPGSESFGLSIPSDGTDSGLVETVSGHAVFLFDEGGVIVGREGTDAVDAATGDIVLTVAISGGNIELHQYSAVVHGDPNDPDEADTPASIDPDVLFLDLTVTDGDLDTASGSLDLGSLIKIEDDGPTLIGGEGGAQNTTVDEDDLPGGTDGSDSLTVGGSIGVDFGSDGPGDVTSITGPAGLFSDGVAITYDPFDTVTNTLTAKAGGSTIFTVSIDPATGQYSFTLSGPIDHGALEDSKALAFDFTVTDGDGDPVDGAFTVDVIDDQPAPVDDEVTVGDAGSTVTNLVIVFDKSGSMDEDGGVAGFATRMDLARAAVAALMNSYNTFGAVNIMIVDFNGSASNSGWLTGDDAVAKAIDYLAGLTPDGLTDYAAAVGQVQSAYGAAPAADQQFVYFLSDGNPTDGGRGDVVGTENDFRLTDLQITAWENFLTVNHFDTAFAVGIGAGVTNIIPLEDIAFPNVDGDNNPIIVTNEAELLSTLVETVGGDASGNVLTNDAFGADGPDGGTPYVKSISFGGTTWTYDKDLDQFSDGVITTGGHLVDITGAHGTLHFDFLTGAFTYEADNVNSTEQETFTYSVLDDDGDEVSADLIVTINDIDTSVIARDDTIRTNIASGDILIPAAALLFNDFHFDGTPLSISAVDNTNATGGTAALGGGGVTFTINPSLPGSFDYTASATGSDDAHVNILVDSSGPLDGTSGREILIANNSGVTVNAGSGSDVVVGGTGNDTLNGDAGADMIMGGAGTDTLNGGAGNDYLDGGNDGVADTLNGNDGDDILVVWTNDVANGGNDSDMIILRDNVNFGSVDGGFAEDVNDNGNDDPGMGNHRGDILIFDGSLNFNGLNAAEVSSGAQVSGIETISMRDHEFLNGDAGNDSLTLQAADVIAMGTGTFDPEGSFDAGGGVDFSTLSEQETIRVDGDTGDTLNLTGGGWVQVTPNPSDVPTGYNLWVHDAPGGGTSEDAYVLVQAEITVSAS